MAARAYRQTLRHPASRRLATMPPIQKTPGSVDLLNGPKSNLATMPDPVLSADHVEEDYEHGRTVSTSFSGDVPSFP